MGLKGFMCRFRMSRRLPQLQAGDGVGPLLVPIRFDYTPLLGCKADLHSAELCSPALQAAAAAGG